MSLPSHRRIPIRALVLTAMFSACATVLMFLDFSVPFMPAFLKMDISEFPALLATFGIGPWSGIAVCLIKNLVNLTRTSTGGVGELSNFLLGVVFVLSAGLVYRLLKHRRFAALIGAVTGSVLMGLVSIPLNYYVTYPIYTRIMPIDTIIGMYQAIFPGVDGLLACLCLFNLPFTVAKGLIDTALCMPVYKRVSRYIEETKH